MLILPNIIEKSGRNTKLIDIPSKLFEEGIVTMFGEVDDDVAYSVITQLLYLDSLTDDSNVKLYISSPGGSIYAGLGIHDVIRNMRRRVDTICFGMAASMGAFLLFSGTGERSALKNSRIMIHSASTGMQGTIHDIAIDLEETKYLNDKLMSLISKYSSLTINEVHDMTHRDNYLSPKESIKLGLIDSVKQ